MNKNNQKNTREVLKNIPSVDEIIRKFQSSNTPLKFLKYSINNLLSIIRQEVLEGKELIDIRDYTLDKVDKLVQKINPNIKIVKSGKISPLIKNSNFVIVIDFSTVILDAHLLKKPVISITVKNNGFGIPFDFRTN